MKDEQKVWIRGVKGRGSEVIKMLEDRGGNNVLKFKGEDPRFILFLKHNGTIFEVCDNESDEGCLIVKECYRELKLPERMWKDGDVLVTDAELYSVFRGDMSVADEGITINAYCGVDDHQIWLTGCNKNTGRTRLATPSEVERFHELLHKHGKEWDAEKKQVVDWKWEPKENDSYYYIDIDGDIIDYIWKGDDYDVDCYNFGNCFRTREEAKVAAEKVKKLLKGEND